MEVTIEEREWDCWKSMSREEIRGRWTKAIRGGSIHSTCKYLKIYQHHKERPAVYWDCIKEAVKNQDVLSVLVPGQNPHRLVREKPSSKGCSREGACYQTSVQMLCMQSTCIFEIFFNIICVKWVLKSCLHIYSYMLYAASRFVWHFQQWRPAECHNTDSSCRREFQTVPSRQYFMFSFSFTWCFAIRQWCFLNNIMK